MPSLFSHAHEPDYVSPRQVETVEETVLLDVPADQAFDGFSDSIHLWWPVAEQSVFGAGSHVALLRDSLVEESDVGEEIVWADIQEWKSPSLISLHWNLGDDVLESNDIDVKFEPTQDHMTGVTISWQRLPAQSSGSSDSFVCDWSLILSRYARFMGGDVKLD